MRLRLPALSVVMAAQLHCTGPSTVDNQAETYGDPGAAAWTCDAEVLSWNPDQEFPRGTRWGGTCESRWSCSDGTFTSTCTASTAGYWDCACDNHGSPGPSFRASGYCDLDEAGRARRSNVGCGWQVPVPAQVR